MKHLKTYKIFEAAKKNELGLTAAQEKFLDDHTGNIQGDFISGKLKKSDSRVWSYNPKTGLVDVQGDFMCERSNNPSIRGIKFGKVTGNFLLRGNIDSTEGFPKIVGENFNFYTGKALKGNSIEGMPEKVGKSFWIGLGPSKIKNLEGGPKEVGGDYVIRGDFANLENLKGSPEKIIKDFRIDRPLTVKSLEGGPKEVGGNFSIPSAAYEDLKGSPRKVGGDFSVGSPNLISLEGSPDEVGTYAISEPSEKLSSLKGITQKVNSISISWTGISNLIGCPEAIPGSFRLSSNDNLVSLEGGPKKVGGNYGVYWCPLNSIEGIPDVIGGEVTVRINREDPDLIDLGRGEWNKENILDAFLYGKHPKRYDLIFPVIPKKWIQDLVDENPEKMAVVLSPLSKHPLIKEIVWPKNIKNEVDLLSDLSDVGL